MMNRCLLGAGVALGIAFGCVEAHAQLVTMPTGQGNWYVGGEGGWTNLNNQTDRGLPAGFPAASGGRSRVNFDDGFNVGARVGYEWGPWRFEEEYSYRRNNLSSFGGFGSPVWKGNRETHALMTNVIYDFRVGWPVTPHLGVGIGAVDVRDNVHRNSVALPNGSVLAGDSWEFGYQAIAGVGYDINRWLSVDLDYRYLATTDATLHDRAFGGNYRTGYDTHNFMASLIVHFAPGPEVAAAPAPMAAPPPPPHKVYLVFFDWDKYTITPEGLQIIQQAAAQWRAGARVRIEVTGYTDRSGSAGYNQRLSQRRAAAVAGALERLGVPRNEMAVQGRGENDNRVPTANGVREPQNRRVEIVFPT